MILVKLEFNAKRELKKLKTITDTLPENLKKATASLITDAAFMAEQLEKLRAYISENGWSEEYQNGANQSGRKTSPEADMYVKVQKLYAATIKQLTDLLPDKAETTAGEEIMAFINRKDE